MKRDDTGTGNALKRLYRQADPDAAIMLEKRYSDAELGLVAQSTNPYGYPINK